MSKFSEIFNLALFYILLFLFIFIPLYPKFPLISVKGSFVSIRVEDILIALSLLIWGLNILLTGKVKSFFKNTLNQALLLFLFIGLVSGFTGYFVTHTVTKNLVIFHYLRRVELMMLLPLAFTSIKTRKQLLVLISTMSVVLFIVSVYAVGQQYLGWKVISTSNSEFSKGQILELTPGGRVNSTFAGQYDLAIYIVMMLSILAATFFYFRKTWQRVWQVILAALSSFVLVLTAARLSFVAAILGVIASLFLVGKKKTVLLIIILAVVAVAYPSQLRQRLVDTFTVNIEHGGQRYSGTPSTRALNQLNIQTLPVNLGTGSASKSASISGKAAPDIAPGEPLDTTQLGVYRSFQIRFNVEWPRALRALNKDPLLGTGYSSIDVATDNDILRSLGEVGLLGTASFILVLALIFRRILKTYKAGPRFIKFISAGVLAALFGFLLNTVFIDSFEASKIAALFWMICGVTLKLGEINERS